MTRKILIASGKGGVGKSTVSASLGRYFASEGLKTLLVDCDAGLSSLDIILNCREYSSFSWYDAFTEKCSPEDSVISPLPGLYLMCSPGEVLKDAPENSIKSVVNKIEKNYDIIIIDAPAGIGRGLMRAAAAANRAIIVATADEVSVSGAAKIEKVLRNSGIRQTRLLINRYDIKAAKKGRMLSIDDIIDKTAVQLIGIIPEDKNIVYSTVLKKIPKKCRSEKAFLRVGKRIQGKNVELTLSLLK